MLDLGDLRGVSISLWRNLCHGQPPIQDPGSEDHLESCAKLSAHAAVQNEVDCRVYQCNYIHYVTYKQNKTQKNETLFFFLSFRLFPQLCFFFFECIAMKFFIHADKKILSNFAVGEMSADIFYLSLRKRE